MSTHTRCGGELIFSRAETVKAGKNTIQKNLHRCDKCGALINIILMPSYEEYVLNGAIRVQKQEYIAIRDRYNRMMQRQKELQA
jgi:hypothetical protein